MIEELHRLSGHEFEPCSGVARIGVVVNPPGRADWLRVGEDERRGNRRHDCTRRYERRPCAVVAMHHPARDAHAIVNAERTRTSHNLIPATLSRRAATPGDLHAASIVARPFADGPPAQDV